ncbi:MAG: PHP domain-containing protein, partial [Pseudomonadota bacterium]
MSVSAYAELHCLTNFSFLRGASHARELVETAHKLGYRALAITDECTMAGVVRAYEAAEKLNFAIIIGTEVTTEDGLHLVLLATSHDGYTRLCQLITQARRAAPKGEYLLTRADLSDGLPGVLVLWCPPPSTRYDQPHQESAEQSEGSRRGRDGVTGACGARDGGAERTGTYS